MLPEFFPLALNGLYRLAWRWGAEGGAAEAAPAAHRIGVATLERCTPSNSQFGRLLYTNIHILYRRPARNLTLGLYGFVSHWRNAMSAELKMVYEQDQWDIA